MILLLIMIALRDDNDTHRETQRNERPDQRETSDSKGNIKPKMDRKKKRKIPPHTKQTPSQLPVGGNPQTSRDQSLLACLKST